MTLNCHKYDIEMTQKMGIIKSWKLNVLGGYNK